MIWVALLTVKWFAALPPKLTPWTLARLVPVKVTEVPPLFDPKFGLIDVTVGVATFANVMLVIWIWAAPPVATTPTEKTPPP